MEGEKGNRMRRLLGLGLIAATTVWAASAGADGGTVCRFVAEFTLSPGLAMDPTSGTFTSGGETGRIACRGGGAGRGEHPFGADGRYGTSDPDTCAAGEGAGVQSFTMPGAEGPEAVKNPIRFVFEAASDGGPMAGRFEGERFSGTFRIVPLRGDCVTGPVTKVLLRGSGHVHG